MTRHRIALTRALSASVPRRVLTLTLFVAFAAFSSSFLAGQDAATPGSPSAPSAEAGSSSAPFPGYRFWKAPADSIDRWPWGSEKYFPIRIDDFNRWLDITDQLARLNDEDESAPGIVSSLTLDARLSDDSLVGSGEFSTVPARQEGTEEHAASESVPYRIRPFSFATSPYSTVEQVDLTKMVGAYADGRFYLPNSKAATRKFFWSQRGTLDRRGVLTFDLRFPNSSRTELKLTTSVDITIEATNGVVREVLSETPAEDQGVVRTWRVYFGGQARGVLRATQSARSVFVEGARRIGVRQENSYRITRKGMELNARLEFERSPNRPEEITLFLDKRLRLNIAEWGAARDVLFELSSFDEQFDKIVIKTPRQTETLDDLKLTAFGSFELDELSALPPLAFEENSAYYWKETTLRLSVFRPLVVSTTVLTDALQFREAFRTRQEGVDVLSYKLKNPQGNVSLKLCTLQKEPTFDSVTDCLILSDAISAKTTLFYNFSGIQDSSVTIPIAPNWSIRSASSVSDDAISWSFEDESAPESEPRRLSISFKKPPSQDRPVKIAVSARLPKSALTEALDVNKLCPVDLSGVLTGAHAVAPHTESPYQVKLTTRSGRPYTAPKASPRFVFSELTLREALPTALESSRIYFGTQTVDARASLENLQTMYAASGTCVCEFFGTNFPDNFVEEWKVRYEPLNGTSLDRVVFYVPGAQEGTRAYNVVWKWSSSLEPDRLYTASRLSETDAKLFNIPDKAAAYEMRLPSLVSSPFDLTMSCKDACSTIVQPLLAIFPESSNASMEVVIDSPQGFRFDAHFVNMRESTVPITVGGKYESLKKAFRYNSNPLYVESAADKKMALSGEPNGENDVPAPETSGEEASALPELTVTFDAPGFADATTLETLPPSARCWHERLDTFFQTNGKSRNRALFYIENRGQTALTLKLPPNVSDASVRAVWVDGRSSSYAYDRVERLIRLQLPLDRRFIGVAIEYYTPFTRLSGGQRLEPSRLICDIPVLSGDWNVWTPPQYQTSYDATKERIEERYKNSWLNPAVLFARKTSEREINELTDRFLTRLGDPDALAAAVPESRKRAAARASESASGVTVTPYPGKIALTWGDVLGNSTLVSWLFAPVVENAQETDGEDGTLLQGARTPFGVLDVSKPFTLYIDRIAASYASTPLTPSSLPSSALTSFDSRARQMLEKSKFALVFVDADTAIVTTRALLERRVDVPMLQIRGASIYWVQKATDARQVHTEIAANSHRYIKPEDWRGSEGVVNPWPNRPSEEVAAGWNRSNMPLCRAETGMRVVNRYFLWALQLFCFIGYVAIVWRLNLARSRFCIGTLGVCAAVLTIATFEWTAATESVAYGALFVLFVRSFLSRGPNVSLESATTLVRDRRVKKEEVKAEPAFDNSIDASTQGFVDFSKMPPEERRRLQGGASDPNIASTDELRSGKIAMKTTFALALTTLLLLTLVQFAPSSGQEPQSAAPTPATANELASEPSWREPHRVFVPVDEEGESVGEYYWVGHEFYDSIRATLSEPPRDRNWRVVDARYEGSVGYNALTDTTTLFNLKATYAVVLDSSQATLVFPALPLSPDVSPTFDRQAISPSFNTQTGELYFNLDDVEPGEHSLEMTFVPPQFSETSSVLSLPILSVPSSRLELNASMDAPALDVPNAQGRVLRGAGWLVAELGAVDQLTLALLKSSDFSTKSSVDVEQLFLARPRTTQLDVRAVFRRATSGGRVKTLDIQCDPAYVFSGTCQYDEGEIENVSPPTDQNNTLRVTFKEPTTGPFTLNVGFIARNFTGVGRMQFPRITTLDARVTRNLFAVSQGPDVEFATKPEWVNSSTLDAFKKAWPSPDDTITSAYDLTALPQDATFSVALKPSELQIDASSTCLFDASETQIRLDAAIQTGNELFRLAVKTPSPFNVDSVSMTDESGAELEQPEYFMSDGALTLVFANPIRGRANLKISGRTTTSLDERRAFPTFEFLCPHAGMDYARVYRASSVFFAWDDAKDWLPSKSKDRAAFGEEPAGDYRFVGVYERAKVSAEPTELVDSNPATSIVRLNSPRYVGVEETALYHELNSPLWKAKVYFRFKVESGVTDQFLILTDEAFSWEIEDPESRFDITETISYAGAHAISLKPKKDLGELIDVRLNATFKNDPDSIRLPKFQLLPSSPREDTSEILRFVALPAVKLTERQNEELNWSTYGLFHVVDDATRGSVTIAVSRMMSAITRDSTPEADQLRKELLTDVCNLTGGLTENEFTFYSREQTSRAKLLSESASLSVARARYAFYMNVQNEYFGTVAFLIRKSVRSSCILVVPDTNELLEVTVNGSRRLVELVRVEETPEGTRSYWRVDLDTTPYVKRVRMTYRGRSKMEPNAQLLYGSRRSPAFCIDFISIGEEIEDSGAVRDVKPERLYWTCAFEAPNADRERWRVFQRGEGEKEKAPTKAERANAEREPILWSDASDLLLRFTVETSAALLEAYESDLSQLTGTDSDDLKRLRAWWELAWRENASIVAQYLETPEGVSERRRRALFIVEGGKVVQPDGELADPTSRWTRTQYDEIVRQKEKLDETYRLDDEALSEVVSPASPQSLWTYDAGVSTSLLFGITDGEARHLIVAATPKRFDFFSTNYGTAAFILIITGLVLTLMGKSRKSQLESLYIVVIVAVWSVVFFFLDKKTIGFWGALLFAVGPAFISSSIRRLKARFGKGAQPSKEELSSIEPDLWAKKFGKELSSTAALDMPDAPASTESLPNGGFPAAPDNQAENKGSEDGESASEEQAAESADEPADDQVDEPADEQDD